MKGEAKDQIEILQTQYDEKVGRLRRGDELPPGVIKLVKVYLAIKRKIAGGDKMAGPSWKQRRRFSNHG